MSLYPLLKRSGFTDIWIKIDFEKQLLDLYEPETFSPGDDWVEIPLDLAGRQLPVIKTTFSFGGSHSATGRFIIDTGGQGNRVLVLDEEGKKDFPGKTIHTLSGTGLRGDVFSDMGRIAELRFGTYSMKNIIATIFPAEKIAETMPILGELGCIGMIGIETLSQFNLVFDYPGRKLFIPG